jgi:membrane dipeptidase
MKKYTLVLSFLVAFLFAANAQTAVGDVSLEKAKALAQKFIIVDTHVDVPYRLHGKMEDISKRTLGGDFDYERAKLGGLDAPFMSIYVPSGLQKKKGESKKLADSLIDMVENLTRQHPEKFALANSPQDVVRNTQKGLISFPMGIENGAPLEDDLANVAYFAKRGVRYITLTHAEDNLICDASYSLSNMWKGLSPFGKKVIEEMNRCGIMIDVSHVSDKTIEQVLQVSKTPIIASHSSCRALTPNFSRNLPDDLIKAIAKKGGVVQINFSSMFLDSAIAADFMAQRAAFADFLLKNEVTAQSKAFKDFEETYKKQHPQRKTTLQKLADHFDHVVKIAGINHVGLGSDFDGVGDTLPPNVSDVSIYPNLIQELLKRGYSERDIEKICYKNTFRVWNKVLKKAAQL